MKTNIFLVLFFLFGFSLIHIQGQTTVNKGKNRVEVIFTNKLTFDDLVKIKADLKAKNITIVYQKIEFDKEKHLSAINISVDCNDGFKGSVSSKPLTNDNKVRFCRDFSKKSKEPFAIEAM